MSSSSSSLSSSSQPLCYCVLEATLKYSNTRRNPGRPFLGCPKYNKEGLPYCTFFKWVDSTEENGLKLRERNVELLRKEKQFMKILDDIEKMKNDIEKMKIEVLKSVDEIKKREMLVRDQEAEIRRSRTLLRVYWVFSVVVSCYLLVLCGDRQ
ncbi:hypothetical protein F2P56_014245 [Juglans regia]|uniref:GRF-type domain-containing protein n=1 Tax=Juglans regia TaxID=51240 RepID=A0A833XCU9_JUGRE|nr:hypothetical protein F2P56_014245 [Juglans regia]